MTTRLGWGDFAKEMVIDAMRDHLGAFAAALAFRILFATLPFLIFVLSVLGTFHQEALVSRLFDLVALAMPQPVVALVQGEFLYLTQNEARGAFTVGAVVAILVALVVASTAFRSIAEAMNMMYGVEDTRPMLRRYVLGVLLSLAVAGLLVVASVLVAYGSDIGNAVADAIGLGSYFRLVWEVAQWPVLIVFVLLAFGLVYYFAPDVEQKFRYIAPGAILGVVLWLTFTIGFLLFLRHVHVYTSVYGALAGIAIHMLYMYYTSYILLLCANVNHIIEAHSPGGKRPGERTFPVEARSGPQV